MQRITSIPRPDWQKTVESQGFHFHTTDERQPYWDESAHYLFTPAEIEALEKATYALNEMCLRAAQHVIDRELFDAFQIPPDYRNWLMTSWDRDEITIYGRFDLAFDGSGPPKLLEYNADTPTSLMESAVIQWFWMKDLFPEADQFNSIHERLIEAWRAGAGPMPGPWAFTCVSGTLEDYMTVNYLRDTAIQAGLDTQFIPIEKLGWNWERNCFVDEAQRPIVNCFKLYPWEWMLREQFGPQVLHDNTRWLEPPWKMILSNKAILPVLSELFPGSPYLLKGSYEPMTGSYVRKPMLSREGANIQRVINDQVEQETDGPYPGPYIYQQLHPIRAFDGNYPVIGSWMVNGYACGIGIREDTSPVTQNTSRFVPHLFR